MENETKINDLENRLSALESQLKAVLQHDDSLEVPMPMRGSILSTFHGEMRKYAILTWCFLGFFSVCAVGCFFAFDAVETTKQQLLFMTFFTMSIMGTVLIKLWYWQVWSRYSVVREVKRLELRIVELVELIKKKN
jgi:hypothetical protein